MIQKTPCEAGCKNQKELGDDICRRCYKATSTEVESPKEKQQRENKENEQFIAMAEEGRERIMARVESLSPKNNLMVMGYFGGEFVKRGYPSPLTRMGRALGIILLAEAIVAMVPEDEKPWMVNGKATDVSDNQPLLEGVTAAWVIPVSSN